MALPKLSIKHSQLDKANQGVIIAASVAVAVFIFGIFTVRGLMQRQVHQGKVIQAKQKALKQLKENVEAKNQLVKSYADFINTSQNVLGGSPNPDATGDRDGDNARIVLDALPSKYDFPALTSSVEKLLTDHGFTIDSIKGVDDEINQQSVVAPTPEPVEMPIVVATSTSFDGASTLVQLFERSIRPFKLTLMEINAEESSLKVTIEATSYYQPEKTLSITKKALK